MYISQHEKRTTKIIILARNITSEHTYHKKHKIEGGEVNKKEYDNSLYISDN